MRFGATTSREDASFDLTPMIDVILLLIVFFMLSSQFSRTERMQVELPAERGDKAAEDEKPSEVILDLTRSGNLYLRSRPVDLAQLPSLLGVADPSAPGPRPTVIVRADRLARAEHLNKLALELARIGVGSWRLGTAPIEGPPAAEPAR